MSAQYVPPGPYCQYCVAGCYACSCTCSKPCGAHNLGAHVVPLLPSAAPKENKPLFSAEYVADREVNRTGQTPSDLQAVLSATARKKSKTDANSRPGSVIKANHSAAAPHSHTLNSSPAGPVNPRGVLDRSSDPSEASGDDAVLGRVIEQRQGGHKAQGQSDVEAGVGLERSGSGRGLALPFKPMSVAFKDISYFVPHPGVSFEALLSRAMLQVGQPRVGSQPAMLD